MADETTRCPQCGKSFAATVRICPDDGTVLEHQGGGTSQLGKVLDGKYRLDAFLSHGGMGSVYRATHVMLGKTVAVKLINPEIVSSPEIVRRFQREARAATALHHPNIVAVYDLGQTADGTLYIAMEFVDGPSLKAVIASGGPVAPTRTIALLRQIGSALSFAHRHNIIHRDLKPHNIMLATSEAGLEVPKLVDFGIAKTFDEATQLTMTGFALGTPQYMSPEQAEGRPVDARSDLYSLGVILYEMLSGDVPFNDSSAPAILIKHIKETPVAPSLKNPRVVIPAELEAIALRCLEKDPARRFQSADEFIAALEHSAASIPGAAAAIQPTMLIGGTPPPVPMATPTQVPAAAPGIAPVPAEPPGTRPTAIPAQVAAAASPPATTSSNTSGFVALLVFLLVALGGAYAYWRQARPQSPALTTEAPPASPAMAAQNPPQSLPESSNAAGQPQSTASATPQNSNPAGQPQSIASATPPVTGQAAGGPAGGSGGTAPGVARGALNGGRNAQAEGGASGSTSSETSSRNATRVREAASALPRGAGATGTGRADVPPASGAATKSGSESAARGQESTASARAATFPENPVVFFQCAGAPEICSVLRTAVEDALEKGGFSSVRNAGRADIAVSAAAGGVQERVSQQFKTTRS